MTEKTAAFADRYKKENLYLGSYGRIHYIPKVDLLSQLSIDLDALRGKVQEFEQKKKDDRKSKTKRNYDFADYRIRIPVPPSPDEMMINPRTKKTFPFGTKTDPTTGELLKEVDSVVQERSIVNQIVFTSEDSSLVYYVDKTGALATENVGNLFKLSEHRDAIIATLEKKIKVTSTYRTPDGTRKSWDPEKWESRFYVNPQDKSSGAEQLRGRIREMSNVDTDVIGIPLFLYARKSNPDFRNYVEHRLVEIENEIKSGKLSVKEQLGSEYASLIVAVLFAEQYQEMFVEQKAEEDKLSNIRPEDAPQIPHIPKEIGGNPIRFLPHQAYALAFLKDRKAAMIDADPGAGKTLMILADVLDKLNRGLCERPCVVMPNQLLPQQKRELEEWTNNSVNIIVINTETVKAANAEAEKLKDQPGNRIRTGLDLLKKTIASAPRNTILMTSYSWLRGLKGRDQLETASGKRFRNPSWLVTQCGVDMLVLDESHTVRIGASGKESDQAAAIMQMSRLVPMKRCFSGTVAPSGPDDIWLQMSFLDPAVLGDRDTFIAKYAASINPNSGKVEAWKPGAIKEVREIITKKNAVCIRRSAWLNQLPKLSVEYHKALLNAAQFVVYKKILDQIIKEELLGEVAPGTIGLELQKELAQKYASNPLAREQISKWKPSDQVVFEDEDPEASIYDSDEDEDDDKSRNRVVFDLKDPLHRQQFKQEQQRIAKLWKQYEAMQASADPEKAAAAAEKDFQPLIAKFSQLDRFLSAPTSVEFGNAFLVEDQDRVSPKIAVIDRILAKHFSDPGNGKVIIMGLQKASMRHIRDNIALSESAVYYDAQNKQALEQFKKDDNVKILVAVDSSLREGHNLQMANRIIRVDLPWNPGDLEQAIARSYRLPPKDPKARRHAQVFVDLVMTEGTAEITKFIRMVSKMHKVRQLVSGFTDTTEFPLFGMNLDNIQTMNTFAHMKAYQDAYGRIREHEIKEAEEAPALYGSKSYELSTGEKMAGSGEIETPNLGADKDKSPWTISPQTAKVIKLNMKFYQGSFWLLLDYDAEIKRIFRGFQVNHYPNMYVWPFKTPKEAADLLGKLRENGVVVANMPDVIAKIKGQSPVNPANPKSTIDYKSLVKKAAGVPAFNPHDEKQRNSFLAFRAAPQHASLAGKVFAEIKKKNPALELKPINTFAAAKLIGLMRLDEKALADNAVREWLVRTSKLLSVIPATYKKLKEDFESAGSPVAPSKPKTDLTQEPADGKIPGLDVTTPDGKIPIMLQVSTFGDVLDGDSVSSHPCFIVSDTSFADPKYIDQALRVMKQIGFREIGKAKTWIYMGDNRKQAQKLLKDFSKNLYVSGYAIADLDAFDEILKKFGTSLEDIWPKKQVEAMRKIATLLDEYPEYLALTAQVFGL
jgi:SNF2 family DNA or RNA helicase